MGNNSPSPSKDIWIKIILLLLGIVAPIVVARIFKNGFYPALIITIIILIGLFIAFIPTKVMKAITIGITLAVGIGLSVYYHFSDRPTFEINIIGLPFKGDSAYYVTDALINSAGDLSAYDDFVLSPISVEVIPHYLGDQKFGNIVLQISGDQGTNEYTLWDDFDKSAETQTLEISLTDILKVTGIKRNVDEQGTSLMVGEKPFQEATINLSIIKLSEPNKPFNPSKELPARNTPWKQEVSVVYRNGVVLDYALTNFGGEATFRCGITLGRALSDVSDDDHEFWSGTEVIGYLPDCEPFTLKTGETYQTTIPLNENALGQNLHHGRYLVHVYSFAERKDIIFNEGYSYGNSNERWLFADGGDVATFVICNDPGKTCEQTDTLHIEEAKISAYTYSSIVELGNGVVYFSIRTYPVNNRSINQYVLQYWIDPQKEGWVGLGIWFEDLLDVSLFNSIRFKLILDESVHRIWMDVEGKVGDTYETSRVVIGDGTYGNPIAEEQTVVVPFSAFDGIDWTQLDTLNFVIDSYMVPDADEHRIRISEIEFIR